MTSVSLFSTALDDQQDNLYKTVKILRDLTEANRRKSKAKPNYSWRAPPFVEPWLKNENHFDNIYSSKR